MMNKIHILLIASAFACNILDAAAPNEIDYDLFFGAIERRDVESVRNFLESNRDIDINYKRLGMTPLHKASNCGHIELVCLFLDSDARIDERTDFTGSTSLIIASINRHIELASILLKRGADVNAKNKQGTTALHVAVTKGSKELVRIFLEHGARTDEKNRFGETAGDLAKQNCFHSIAQLITSWNEEDIKEPEGE